jgi:hypothetical protein
MPAHLAAALRFDCNTAGGERDRLETSVCILDKDGTRIFEGKVASEPAPIARLIRKRAPGVVRVGLESGLTSVWLTLAV